MSRIYNFCAGPATLPEEVLAEAREQLIDYQGTGMSIMESSHRGKAYDAVHQEAMANFKDLLGVGDEYAVLFLQGGASTQFAMIPMNMLGDGQTADYVNSGAWAGKAIKEAQKRGSVNVVANTSDEIPTRMPSLDELHLTDGAAYLHMTSNETIAGTRVNEYPDVRVPVVADMSSDILSRPLDANKFGLIYAGAQKNLGPAGCALVVIRKDLAERAPENIPTMLQYRTHVEKDSLYNTPPCFTIYIMMLVTRWIKRIGLEELYKRNVAKAAKLYAAIDGTDFYIGTALPEYRSDMNVTFRIANHDLEPVFVQQAETLGLNGLKGHRSVGGLRASIYNAFPEAGVDALVQFMKDFEAKNG